MPISQPQIALKFIPTLTKCGCCCRRRVMSSCPKAELAVVLPPKAATTGRARQVRTYSYGHRMRHTTVKFLQSHWNKYQIIFILLNWNTNNKSILFLGRILVGLFCSVKNAHTRKTRTNPPIQNNVQFWPWIP